MYRIGKPSLVKIKELVAHSRVEDVNIYKNTIGDDNYFNSVVNSVMQDNSDILYRDDVAICVFGVNTDNTGYPCAWCLIKDNISKRDGIVLLRKAKKIIKSMYDKYGDLYAPIYKGWKEEHRLLRFLGFREVNKAIAVYSGGI